MSDPTAHGELVSLRRLHEQDQAALMVAAELIAAKEAEIARLTGMDHQGSTRQEPYTTI